MDSEDLYASSAFKLLVNFVYEEVYDQFINNNGVCKRSTYSLINWSFITDSENKGKQVIFLFLI